MVRRKTDLSTTELIAVVQVRAEALSMCRPRGFPNTRRKCFATIKRKIRTKAQLLFIGRHSQFSKRRNYKQHRCDLHFEQPALISDSPRSPPWDQGCRARRDRSQGRCQRGVCFLRITSFQSSWISHNQSGAQSTLRVSEHWRRKKRF